MARTPADNDDVEAVNSGSLDKTPLPEPDHVEVDTGDVITDEISNPDKAIADEGLEPEPTASGSLSPDDKKLLSGFLKLSGYKRNDILAWSNERRTVVCKNGSKYQVSKNGKQLKILSGAVPPSAVAEA